MNRIPTSGDSLRQRTSVQDAEGNVVQSLYEARSTRLWATIDALGYRTTYAYDSAGRLTTIQYANGGVVSLLYDLAGRRQAIVDEGGYRVTSAYDAAGQLKSQQYHDGRRITYAYDPTGNPTTVQYYDGTVVSYSYDGLGQRLSMQDSGGTTTYAYSARGESIGKRDPGDLFQAYAYDPTGNRTKLVDPDGGVYTYLYDAVGRTRSVQPPFGAPYTNMYDADGRKTTLQAGLGTTRAYQYDAVGRLTTEVATTSGGVRIMTIVDAYDRVGNRKSRSQDGALTQWSYDANYRLIGQNATGAVATYAYDQVGNLTVKNQQGSLPLTMTYDWPRRLRYISDGAVTTTLVYDIFGNNTAEQTMGQTLNRYYDARNQLVREFYSSTTPDISNYSYDGDGKRRSATEASTGTTTMVWDGDDYLQRRNTPRTNGAAFVSQDVPRSMAANGTYTAKVKMRNVGTGDWSRTTNHKLGTQAPQDNTVWTGGNRVWLPAGVTVTPGQDYEFSFTITAPATPGLYQFQWRMVQESVEWFGEFSPLVGISVY